MENRASWLTVVAGWELKNRGQRLAPKSSVSKALEIYSDDFLERRN